MLAQFLEGGGPGGWAAPEGAAPAITPPTAGDFGDVSAAGLADVRSRSEVVDRFFTQLGNSARHSDGLIEAPALTLGWLDDLWTAEP